MLEKITEIARKAGSIVLESSEKIQSVSSKAGLGNFVTEIDVQVQNFIKSQLMDLIPNAAFMGEEDGEDHFSDTEYLFIVDPIDGTQNFIRDLKYSCVSIALVKNGSPYIGVVYNPYLDEMFYAQAGSGAFLNGKPMHIEETGLSNSIVIFGTSPYYRDLTDKTFDIVKKLMATVSDVRRFGAAALDMCNVAAGRADLFFELILSPWDFAAASLIIQEAGGTIVTDDFVPVNLHNKSCVFAGSKHILDEFRKLVQ